MSSGDNPTSAPTSAPGYFTTILDSNPIRDSPSNESRTSGSSRAAGPGMASGMHLRTSSFADSEGGSLDGFREQMRQEARSITDSNESPAGRDDAAKADDATAGVPAWTELKTKAGKERKRLPLACIACRRKKIRCSGESPACKHCVRSRIPCVYKVTARKAAPRTDYMAMLDKRLKRMEERVLKIIPKEEHGILEVTGRAAVKPSAATTGLKAGPRKRAATEAFDDGPIDEWANGVDSRRRSIADNGIQSQKDLEEQNLLLEGADKLPSREIQEHLAEVFFDFVYGQNYLLLHKPSFMRKLARGTVPPVLMLAMCAISARFSTHPELRTEPAFLRGGEWAEAAREISFRRYDQPSLTILIVYLILGLHEFGTCHGGRSWMLGGMAQRMAYALQLHKDLDHDLRGPKEDVKVPLSITDREIRRRTMWACFLMDRFNSSGRDRPIFVSEQYIRAQLPIKESYYLMELSGPTEDLEGNVPHPAEPDSGQLTNARDNMGVAAYLVRIMTLWGRLIRYMSLGGRQRDKYHMWEEKSEFVQIKKDTLAWKETLPAELQYNTENLQNHASEKIANQFLFIHIVYNQILLFMSKFALPVPGTRPSWPEDMPVKFRTDAARVALEAANQISRLINVSMNHNVVGPFAAYAAFTSSTVHIPLALSSKKSHQAALSKQYLAWNVKYITKMKRYWGMLSFVSDTLREQWRVHADAVRSGRPSTEVQIGDPYGNAFDHYEAVMSGTDNEAGGSDQAVQDDVQLDQKSDMQTVEEYFARMSPVSRSKQMQGQKSARRRTTSRPDQPRPNLSAVSSAGAKSSPSDDSRTQRHGPQVVHDLASIEKFQSRQAFLPRESRQPSQPSSSAWLPESLQQPSYPRFEAIPQPATLQQPMPSFSGMDAGQFGGGLNPPSLDMDMSVFDNFDPAAFTGNTNQSTESNFWGDPATAWFMPFNLEPPANIGALSGGTTGLPDWSNPLAGIDNVFAQTSWPPQMGAVAPADLEMGSSENPSVMGGFDPMQIH